MEVHVFLCTAAVKGTVRWASTNALSGASCVGVCATWSPLHCRKLVIGSPGIWVATFHAWSEAHYARSKRGAAGRLGCPISSQPGVLVQRNARRFSRQRNARRLSRLLLGAVAFCSLQPRQLAVSPPTGFYIQCRQGGSTLVPPGIRAADSHMA